MLASGTHGEFRRDIYAGHVSHGYGSVEHEDKVMGIAPYADPVGAERVCSKMKACSASIHGANRISGAKCPEKNCSSRFLHLLLEIAKFDRIAGLARFKKWSDNRWVTGLGKRAVTCCVVPLKNVKANKMIMELPEIEELFLPPSGSDNPLGDLSYEDAATKRGSWGTGLTHPGLLAMCCAPG